jgi:transposase-like protein
MPRAYSSDLRARVIGLVDMEGASRHEAAELLGVSVASAVRWVHNFAAHKIAGIREAIEKAGATLRYLPKYSPDLNPIELAYSKFKQYLRKAAQRTVRGLYRAIRTFVPQLSAQECANYLRHAGYVSI